MSDLHRTAGELRADGCFVSEDISDETLVSAYDTSRQVEGTVIPVILSFPQNAVTPQPEVQPKNEAEAPIVTEATPAPAVGEKAVSASPENKAVTKTATKKPKKNNSAPSK